MSDLPPENRCRHYLGLYPDNRPACAMGRDVRAWAMRCNGGSERGIALRLPCTRKAADAEAPLFDCPSLDRETQEEVDRKRAAMSDYIDRFTKGLPRIQKMKAKMIKNRLSKAKATCPWCGEKDALTCAVALDVNNHMRVSCRACDMGLME